MQPSAFEIHPNNIERLEYYTVQIPTSDVSITVASIGSFINKRSVYYHREETYRITDNEKK